MYSGTPSFACTGTVVSQNVVLTAGHCVVNETTGVAYSPGGYQVVTGRVDWTDTAAGQVTGVSRTVVYPGFNRSTVDGDAGLLVLSTPTNAPLIRLATSADIGLIQPGTGAVITGWGVTHSGAGQLPSSLQWGSTVVQSGAYCQQYAAAYDPLKLCAIDPPSFSVSTCFGDSGGPLIASGSAGDPVEIGITSSGSPDCATTVPDIFTRVDLLSGWTAGWVAAVAPAPRSPAPPPPAATTSPKTPSPPTSRLPRMGSSDAASFVRQTLAGAFGSKFRLGRQYQAQCSRLATARFRCAVDWSYSRYNYAGSVTVFYKLIRGQAKWSNSYRVRAVNVTCSPGSSRRRLCRVHVVQGSW